MRIAYVNNYIYTADEMELFLKMTPERIFKFKAEKYSDVKMSREIITVLGKSKHPCDQMQFSWNLEDVV